MQQDVLCGIFRQRRNEKERRLEEAAINITAGGNVAFLPDDSECLIDVFKFWKTVTDTLPGHLALGIYVFGPDCSCAAHMALTNVVDTKCEENERMYWKNYLDTVILGAKSLAEVVFRLEGSNIKSFAAHHAANFME